jgi:hypothetical protein
MRSLPFWRRFVSQKPMDLLITFLAHRSIIGMLATVDRQSFSLASRTDFIHRGDSFRAERTVFRSDATFQPPSPTSMPPMAIVEPTVLSAPAESSEASAP